MSRHPDAGTQPRTPRFSARHPRRRPQVLAALSLPAGNTTLRQYDAADPLPNELADNSPNSCSRSTLVRAEAIYKFLNRAIEAVALAGEVFCTLPGRPTRPGIEGFQAETQSEISGSPQASTYFLSNMAQSGYQVPRFELAAFGTPERFSGNPLARRRSYSYPQGFSIESSSKTLTKESSHSFARNPAEFRIFLRGTAQAEQVVVKDLAALLRECEHPRVSR